MPGSIGILNVGAGDTKLVFDDKDPAGKAKAAATVRDMIRKGFVLLIEAGTDEKGEPVYRRAKDFDPDTAEYIVAGTIEPQENDTSDHHDNGEPAATAGREAPARKGAAQRRKAKPADVRIAASSTNAVAVARTAGG